jgi:ATP-binding cassette subfamily F protein uup
VRQYEGGYSDYDVAVAIRNAETAGSGAALAEEKASGAKSSAGEEKSSKDTWKNKEKKLKLTYKEAKELETIDDDIAALEELIEQLEKDMQKFTSDFVKLNQIMEQKSKAEADLEYKMERWIYLNELQEQIANQ